jgi:rod shape-determining protein MreD
MGDPILRERAGYAVLFLGLAALSLFVRLLPFGSDAAVPGPDVVLALACAWIMRRPDYLPVLLIALVILVEDMLLHRPPGLWAVAVVLGTEYLRNRQPVLRNVGFALEWATVGAVMLAMLLLTRTVMVLTMTPLPSLGLSLIQLLATVAAYPLLAGASHWVFGVRKPATGEVDVLGRRL